jgi:hypothetical protein
MVCSHNLIPCLIKLVAVVVASNCISSLHAKAKEDAESKARPSGVPTFQQTVEHGILIIDGSFIRLPYVIEASGNRVTVNGVVCFEEAENRPDDRENSIGRRRNRRGDDEEEGARHGSPERFAERLADELDYFAIVVASSSGGVTVLTQADQVMTFCEVLLAEDRSHEQITRFLALSRQETRVEVWRELLTTSVVDGEARNALQKSQDRLRATYAAGRARVAAVARMEKFSYPLTLAAMLVGVIALGHVMKWTARTIVAEQREDYAPQIARCVEIALLLMLVMSSIDLVWTILAGQAGVMREVNPFAAGFIQSPLQLVMLKVCATGLGCGILYIWRQKPQIQDATWWMCLVCVLLTFRWVVFDSVLG